ncbi:endoplasmic reticulum resident protein 44 [Diabrotica virgifera virgifera]|uniref:Endoplasmic reticulum resident protein 44-like n=1 Tax=Diabrotica virgifera virgifera TaxID=50390 RepID=A0A6P7GDE9_DIAVI|nr:endoplasmic reticulum resident protein 44 [Diabrotica virgifera virgifera]
MTSRISKIYNIRTTLFLLTTIIYLIEPTESGALQLTEQNFNTTLDSNELAFIMFYTDWCRHSRALMPIFDETADGIAKEFPEAGKVVLGRVECEREMSICAKYEVRRWPTLLPFSNLPPENRKKYTGNRTVEALTTFVKDQWKELKELKERKELKSESE